MNSQPTPGSKPDTGATKELSGEGFKRPGPPVIRMGEALKAKVENIINP